MLRGPEKLGCDKISRDGDVHSLSFSHFVQLLKNPAVLSGNVTTSLKPLSAWESGQPRLDSGSSQTAGWFPLPGAVARAFGLPPICSSIVCLRFPWAAFGLDGLMCELTCGTCRGPSSILFKIMQIVTTAVRENTCARCAHKNLCKVLATLRYHCLIFTMHHKQKFGL